MIKYKIWIKNQSYNANSIQFSPLSCDICHKIQLLFQVQQMDMMDVEEDSLELEDTDEVRKDFSF